jgi:hypothetical protein
MAKLNDRIVVFAGAGASKAVNPSQFPTTKEFFERLPTEVVEHPVYQFSLNYLQTKQKLDSIDIEHVLWTLQELFEFYDNIATGKGPGGFATRRDLLTQLIPGHHVGHLNQLADQIRDRVGNLISEINQVVYDLYGYEPNKRELNRNWAEIISRLDGVATRLDLFTTNYDGVIEAALSDYAGDATARMYRGIRGTIRQSLALDDWGHGSPWQPIFLTKLHGSLDWKYSRDRSVIHVGDPVFTGDHTKHAIIYPGFKGSNDAPFFDAFHNYLGESLADAKAVAFVGFAFRDDYINNVIREGVRPDSTVVVINPDSSVELPSRRIAPKYIRESFDKRAVDRLCTMLGVE